MTAPMTAPMTAMLPNHRAPDPEATIAWIKDTYHVDLTEICRFTEFGPDAADLRRKARIAIGLARHVIGVRQTLAETAERIARHWTDLSRDVHTRPIMEITNFRGTLSVDTEIRWACALAQVGALEEQLVDLLIRIDPAAFTAKELADAPEGGS